MRGAGGGGGGGGCSCICQNSEGPANFLFLISHFLHQPVLNFVSACEQHARERCRGECMELLVSLPHGAGEERPVLNIAALRGPSWSHVGHQPAAMATLPMRGGTTR